MFLFQTSASQQRHAEFRHQILYHAGIPVPVGKIVYRIEMLNVYIYIKIYSIITRGRRKRNFWHLEVPTYLVLGPTKTAKKMEFSRWTMLVLTSW